MFVGAGVGSAGRPVPAAVRAGVVVDAALTRAVPV